MTHLPVLLEEVVEGLAPTAGDVIVDGTFGGGGYAKAILATADCTVVAIDRDETAIARAKADFGGEGRLQPVLGCFGDMAALLPQAGHVLSQDDHADLAEALATIDRRGQHLSAFILSFKQLSQPVKANLQLTDLVTIINNCLALQRSALARHNIQLKLALPDQAKLWLDEALTEQVLINLLQNALEALQQTSDRQLDISLQQNRQHGWQLDICDNGPGISEQVAKQIFIPFFTTKTQGSGIGLSLSRALLQAQDAQLQYVPGPAPGSCFRITFKT